MVKKQQMRWSPRGAHLLLQVRTRVLNNGLAGDFARWYPRTWQLSTATGQRLPDLLRSLLDLGNVQPRHARRVLSLSVSRCARPGSRSGAPGSMRVQHPSAGLGYKALQGRPLAELRQWADTMLRREYGGYQLPECWANHPHAIWELSALAAEWHRTYNRKRPGLNRALEFNDRWLPGSMRRITDITRRCNPECVTLGRAPGRTRDGMPAGTVRRYSP
jgi:hypothetical protein